MAFIARLPRVEGSPWVFPRVGDSARHISPEVMQNAWQRIRHHAGLKDVNMHDLRHTVGTWASKAGANAFAIRDVLRHQNVSMTARYVNADVDPLRELHNTVGTAINAALEGRTADVISLMGKRRRDT
jgi:integrase